MPSRCRTLPGQQPGTKSCDHAPSALARTYKNSIGDWPIVWLAPINLVLMQLTFVDLDNSSERQKAAARWPELPPWLVASSFGLLHGFGFAGALAEVGLPETDIPLALLVINLGVEAGRLLFVAGVLTLLWLGRRVVGSPPRWLQDAPAYAIGALAAFWLIERVAAFG